MEAVLHSLDRLSEAEVRTFVQHCLHSGMLPVEAASASLHRMRFESFCLRHPWRRAQSFQTVLGSIPWSCSPLVFLKRTEQYKLTSISRLCSQYFNDCSILRSWCIDAGIRPPRAICDAVALKGLYRIASATRGAIWNMENVESVYEATTVGHVALKGIDLGRESVWRISFTLPANRVSELREFLASPQYDDETRFEIRSQIPGFSPDYFADLSLSFSNEDGKNLIYSFMCIELVPDYDLPLFDPEDFYGSKCRVFPLQFEYKAGGIGCEVYGRTEVFLFCEIEADTNVRSSLSPAFAKLVHALENGQELLFLLRQARNRE